MKVLVCGGAGYIGSHMAWRLHESGHDVVVLDNLSTGHAVSVEGLEFVRADIRDARALDQVFGRWGFDAVMHFCASSLVSESMRQPVDYWDNNVSGTLGLIAAMRRAEVDRLVFSSTAAIFGKPQAELIDEFHATSPINPYGATKLAVEQLLQQIAHSEGFRSIALRYFNAAGASLDGQRGESHEPETHLIPNVLRAALGTGPALMLYGNDYPTRDGYCVRDFVHVLDLAEAHLLALESLDKGAPHRAFNLGNGVGHSVKEVLDTAKAITGIEISATVGARRDGDPAVLVADSARARAELGWQPKHSDLHTIIESAWRWHQSPRY